LADPYSFDCDVVGVVGDYETTYVLASTFSAGGRHIQGSNLVLMSRYRYDIKDDHYEVVQDPTGTAVDFDDPDTYWFKGPLGPEDYPQGGGKPKGWKTVLCTTPGSDVYAPNAADVLLGIGFVQSPDCPEEDPVIDGEVVERKDLEECVTYEETFTRFWDVTLSQGGQRVAADSVDDSPSVDRAHSAKKQGKHRGKGKRGR
jgi:hypothetical protein